MPDTGFDGFLPIDPIFHNNPHATYGAAPVTVGLDSQQYDAMFHEFIARYATLCCVSIDRSGHGLGVANVKSALFQRQVIEG